MNLCQAGVKADKRNSFEHQTGAKSHGIDAHRAQFGLQFSVICSGSTILERIDPQLLHCVVFFPFMLEPVSFSG